MIRVLLVDDHASLLESLAFMFDQEPDFAVVGEARSLEEAREMLYTPAEAASGSSRIDVAVVDITLPDGEGTALIGDLRATNPHCAILILSGVEDPAQLARAAEAGAAGIMHKSAGTREVINAARRLAAGEQLISPEELSEMLRLAAYRRKQDHEARVAIGRLTPREREVLQALAEGSNDHEIAGQLYVSAGAVRTHVANILAKLGTASRLQALVLAAQYKAVKIDRASRPRNS
jgi:DNA-binding NarL/FixJ family response regulator